MSLVLVCPDLDVGVEKRPVVAGNEIYRAIRHLIELLRCYMSSEGPNFLCGKFEEFAVLVHHTARIDKNQYIVSCLCPISVCRLHKMHLI